jgi:two-component system cell cycle sensor histidine kinase/response regulator CckA
MATILVVDDERQICILAARVLEKEGFFVLIATSGSEALRIAHSYPGGLDLLLSDIEMPGMGGEALVRQLRAESPSLPVILMSGTANLAALGVSKPASFLVKPFSIIELATMANAMVHSMEGDLQPAS